MKIGYSIWKPFVLVIEHVFKRSFTIKYPYAVLEPQERTIGRHLLDLDSCISCGLCAKICPSQAITLVEVDEIGKKVAPQLDYGRCIFCELCTWICPRNAIKNTTTYELSSYDKKSLVYSPRDLAELPKKKEKRPIVELKFHKHLGPSHSRKT